MDHVELTVLNYYTNFYYLKMNNSYKLLVRFVYDSLNYKYCIKKALNFCSNATAVNRIFLLRILKAQPYLHINTSKNTNTIWGICSRGYHTVQDAMGEESLTVSPHINSVCMLHACRSNCYYCTPYICYILNSRNQRIFQILYGGYVVRYAIQSVHH